MTNQPPPPPWPQQQPPPSQWAAQPPVPVGPPRPYPPPPAGQPFIAPPSGSYAPAHPIPEGTKNYVATVVLSIFLGMFGVDRFYLGKVRSGIWKLVTIGGFGYWWLFDVFYTLFGGQRDAWGLRLEGYARNKKRVWITIGLTYAGIFALGLASMAVTASVDANGPTPFGWAAISTLLAAGAATGAFFFLRRRWRSGLPVRRTVDPVPREVRARLDALADLRPRYESRAASGDDTAAAVGAHIDSLVSNSAELFRRLTAKSQRAERDRAAAEYEDKLGKLADALAPDYLLDILDHPRLWDDPQMRVRQVREAAHAVDEQVLDNIRQVNARRSLVFQARLNVLRGRDDSADEWQRDFDAASGND